MVELARHVPDDRLDAPGLGVAIRQPARLYLRAGSDDIPAALRINPRHSLVVCEADGPAPDGFVSDMTDGLIRFVLAGSRAADIIAMATSFRAAPGQCAPTLWAGVTVILHRTATETHLYVERPLAPWLLAWFRTALSALG